MNSAGRIGVDGGVSLARVVEGILQRHGSHGSIKVQEHERQGGHRAPAWLSAWVPHRIYALESVACGVETPTRPSHLSAWGAVVSAGNYEWVENAGNSSSSGER